MNLSDYIREQRGRNKHLARALGRAPIAVSRWVTAQRKVPVEHCPTIERLTNGQVTCEEMRPDVDWGVLRKSSNP